MRLQDKRQLFVLPKNLESGKGPSASSSPLKCLDFDLCLFSFLFLDLDFDLFDSLESSSLLEDDSDDELEELESEDFLEYYIYEKPKDD